MKLIILFLMAFVVNNVFSGTCTSISRTNAGANTVLTSTKYNNDLNTAYTHVNDLDGGCITDGTLEFAALNTSEFATILKTPMAGCKLSRASASAISISECDAAINGAYVNTATASQVSWGCTGCASEATATRYYVYIKNGASGTEIGGDLLISTGAPNDNGYDGSNNRVIGRFLNDSNGDVATDSMEQWHVNDFVPKKSGDYIRCIEAAGLGSTLTGIRIFKDGECTKVGTSITHAQSAANGSSYTINDPGVYSISYSDLYSGGVQRMGISLNTNQGATAIQSIDNEDRLAITDNVSTSYGAVSYTGYFKAGDVIRPHTSGGYNGTTQASFDIVRVSP